MTLHVDNIWHSYLVFFEKKIKHGVCQILFLAACQSQIECPLLPNITITIPQVHLTYMCVFSYSHIKNAIHTSIHTSNN